MSQDEPQSPVLATPVIALPERVTLQGVAAVLEQLKAALGRQAGPVVALDAHALRVFDSSALALLLELRRHLQAQDKTLQLLHLPRQMQDLAALYGVSELLST